MKGAEEHGEKEGAGGDIQADMEGWGGQDEMEKNIGEEDGMVENVRWESWFRISKMHGICCEMSIAILPESVK